MIDVWEGFPAETGCCRLCLRMFLDFLITNSLVFSSMGEGLFPQC